MSMARRQFGSIEAVFSARDRLGQVRADGVVLHTVGTLEDVSALIEFWQRQKAAPSSEAITSALGWVRLRFSILPVAEGGAQ